MPTKSRDVEIQIDGTPHRFTVNQLPAFRALRIADRLVAAIGPALGSLLSASAGGKPVKPGEAVDLGSLDVGVAAGAISILFSKLDEAALERLVRELLEGSTVDVVDGNGRTQRGPILAQFDVLFSGNLLAALKLLRAALEVNYGDFFAALTAKPAPAASAQSSAGSITSTGGSGASS